MQITTVTQKGQITLPKSIRDKHNIRVRSKMRIESGDGYIKLIPEVDFFELGGFLAVKNKGKSPMQAREYMEKNYKRV